MQPPNIQIRRVKGRQRVFELMSNDRLFGTLEYPHRFRKAAIIRIVDSTWSICRKGVFRHRLEIAADQSPYSKWNLRMGWSAVEPLRMEDHKLFEFRKRGFWSCSWQWLDERKDPLIDIRLKKFSIQKRADILCPVNIDRDAAFLMLIGWFVVLCYEDDAAVVAMAG